MVRKLIRLGLFGKKARQRLQLLEYAEEENRVYRQLLQREDIPLPEIRKPESPPSAAPKPKS